MTQETEQGSRWENFKERLKNTYRLVVMNDETFEEVSSYRLSLLNVYVLLSSLFVVMAIVVFLLIAATPLKKYLPGYGSVQQDKEVRELYQQMDEMEKELANHRRYSENFRKILVGDVETEKEIPQEEEEKLDTIAEIPRAAILDQLQREAARSDVGSEPQEGRASNLSPRDVPLEQMYFTPPLRGTVSAGYAPETDHYGIDVLAPKNTPVQAAMDGYVFLSDWTLETGNTIGIQHTNNTITFYKHNSSLLKPAGSYVKAGEAVAIIGNTGTLSNGPHLHFELWYKGKSVDPTGYIEFE
ncbi:MAG: M23 family metallopeptidase [Saprospiraceae bacterium]|nr:M23 family metallopeptidase [Saprospiraceae bacterium]